MAKLQLKQEWRLWGGIAIVLVALVGYLYLASRPPMEGGEYLWHVTNITGPDQLRLKGTGKTIDFTLIGLRIPSSQIEAAREFLTKTLNQQWVRIKTVRESPNGTPVGFVYLSGEDINARFIRLGLAELDREEKDFDVRPYIELEQEAKRQQRGMWAESDRGAK